MLKTRILSKKVGFPPRLNVPRVAPELAEQTGRRPPRGIASLALSCREHVKAAESIQVNRVQNV
jgi:hypothetical protein